MINLFRVAFFHSQRLSKTRCRKVTYNLHPKPFRTSIYCVLSGQNVTSELDSRLKPTPEIIISDIISKKSSKRPMGAQGRPKGSHGRPKRHQRGPKESQRTAKGSQRESKGIPKGAKGTPKSSQRQPRAPQRHPREVKGTRSIFQTPDQPPKQPLC